MGFVLIELTFEGRLVLIFTFMIIFQMLSMRNGLSLHTMFFQEGLQPLQLSQVPRMDSGEESRLIPSNPTASLPMHQENPMHYLSNLPNKLAMADQQSVPTPSYIINSETSFRLESPIPENIRSFQLRRFPEVSSLTYVLATYMIHLLKSLTMFIFILFFPYKQMCREDILQHQHLNANH